MSKEDLTQFYYTLEPNLKDVEMYLKKLELINSNLEELRKTLINRLVFIKADSREQALNLLGKDMELYVSMINDYISAITVNEEEIEKAVRVEHKRLVSLYDDLKELEKERTQNATRQGSTKTRGH